MVISGTWIARRNSLKLIELFSRNKVEVIFQMLSQEAPFSMKKDDNHTGNAAWEGFCMDMLTELAERLEFNYVLHGSYDGKFGGKSAETQEWNGMVREIVDGVS